MLVVLGNKCRFSYGSSVKFKSISIVFVTVFLFFGCESTQVERKTLMSLTLDEVNGIKSYKAGDYKTAFELLKTTATWGYKGSQYTIAFMFLKGQYVQQSTLLGMGWLGVATEMETEDWSDQYRTFYGAATPLQKAQIDTIVEEYIKRYGMKAQHVTCKKFRGQTLNQNCFKSDRLSKVYDIDMVE